MVQMVLLFDLYSAAAKVVTEGAVVAPYWADATQAAAGGPDSHGAALRHCIALSGEMGGGAVRSPLHDMAGPITGAHVLGASGGVWLGLHWEQCGVKPNTPLQQPDTGGTACVLMPKSVAICCRAQPAVCLCNSADAAHLSRCKARTCRGGCSMAMLGTVSDHILLTKLSTIGCRH